MTEPRGKRKPLTLTQSGDEIQPTPGKNASKIDLRDSHAIRREMAAVYRDMRRGTIETQDGTRLIYVLAELRKAYETCILDERINLLEKRK